MQHRAKGCRVRFEPAKESDDEALRALLHKTPMGGSISVAFLREPGYFSATRIQGPFIQVFIAKAGEEIVGAATRAIRPIFLNGKMIDGGYLSDLRVVPEFRRGMTLARGYRYLRNLHEDGRAAIYTTVIVEDNKTALRTVGANRADMPTYRDQGRILTPMISLQKRLPEIPAEIRSATREDFPAIVAKLNEKKMQFQPVYTEKDLLDGRFQNLQENDFRMLFRQGKLVGVMAAWNQMPFRQTVVKNYAGAVGVLRPFINLFRTPPLPATGEPLPFFYIAFSASDTVEDYRTLLRSIYNESIDGPHSHMIAGLHERDPRLPVLYEYPHTHFAGRLFSVTFDGPIEIDDRVPHIEAALL
ncbi:MAG: hypothetical protein CMO47_00050 [Verrucomicrobiales bacterium]|nr:hypothetical protein [Verrucomicrobiales bacterium]